jgi:NADPH:quinone reductase-like Zn-dependent oxidoreductase
MIVIAINVSIMDLFLFLSFPSSNVILLIYYNNGTYNDGAEADYVIAIDSEIAPKPQSLDHECAAAVPMAGLTAWQALFDHAHLSSKDTILIHGAAGGVVALQYNLLDRQEYMSLGQL